ncbi:helix-turn-helix domain-containing protein [Weissella muntiaci]|uniref:helix-turn-helix domain-containing protein n=1 Tax=Weissella muntiaci TaxID=2508881 RepID=UPI001FE4FF89|nr:helix-turn-helix transcriptional regulator [Weissella muntiaci]
MAKEKKISLKQLALSSGLNENAIYDWQKSTPKVDNLKKVADTLNVSVDYLLGDTDEKEKNIVTVTKKTTDAELDRLLDSTESYDGKELNDQDRKTMKDLIKAYVRNKPE